MALLLDTDILIPFNLIGRQKLEIRERIFFASDKADILRPSFSILDHLAKVILDHPELPPIVVEGHTDDRGLGAHNRKLSQERAQAVCAYLIDKGVAPGRVRPKSRCRRYDPSGRRSPTHTR